MRIVYGLIVFQLLQSALTFSGLKDEIDSCPIEGCKGHPGDMGPVGPQGARGPPGFCNCTGDVGVPGRSGMPGKQGLKGETGKPGYQGPKGEPGVSGTSGTCSNETCPARVGPPGPPGRGGEKGLPGMPGPVSPGVAGTEGESRVSVMQMFSSEPCSLAVQGALRLDPHTKQLYYCDGDKWTCLETTICREPPCVSPYGPQPVGGMWYQIFTNNVTVDNQDAADIVLVVDESGSMNREHEWLLIMIPKLEQALVEAGVGVGVRNRYCMVGFGSFEAFESGHFILVDGQPCFLASDFPRARAKLLNAGLYEDGYQAIDFSLRNIPFRDSPFIAKNIILITDEGRTPIPAGRGLNFTYMEAVLGERDVLLNVVVWAEYKLRESPDAVVLGVDYSGLSYVLEPGGRFSVNSGPLEIIDAEKDTAEAYVDLALSVGGASWALMILRESSITSNVTLQESFTSALTQIKVQEITAQIESCRKCKCLAGEVTTRISCEIAEDEELCQCVVMNDGNVDQCVSADGPESVGAPGAGDVVTGGRGASPNNRFSIPRSTAADYSNNNN